MTTRQQILRSSTPGQVPAAGARAPGEMWTTFPDLQIGVIDASRNAQRLIAVRYFSAAANYVAGDFVIQAGALYVAKGAVSAGAFNATQWTKVATGADAGGPYLPIAGGTLTGSLTLNADPVTPLGAATRQYVDAKGGLVNNGVTDGSNAAAGQIGEFVSSVRLVGNAMAVLTGTAKDVASLVLQPGDWDVSGNCFLTGATAGAVSALNFWLNTASATLPVPTASGIGDMAIGVNGISNGSGGPTGRLRVNVTTATTVYMSAIVNFASGAASLYGAMTARRAR